MNLDSLNKWLMFAANLGVIAGILFLGIEINQNRELTKAQIRHELSQGAIDTILREASDPTMAAISLKGMNDEAMTPEESLVYERLVTAWFRYIESVHYQYRNGLYDESEFSQQQNVWRQRFEIPSVVRLWCQVRQNFSAELAEEVGALDLFQCE